jgi:hypothetical protein
LAAPEISQSSLRTVGADVVASAAFVSSAVPLTVCVAENTLAAFVLTALAFNASSCVRTDPAGNVPEARAPIRAAPSALAVCSERSR